MYLPPAFTEDDPDRLHAFIRRHGFGLLISTGVDGPAASAVPFLLDEADGTLLCHLARANPHWRAIASAGRALAVFSGPDAYVSPAWYAAGPVVPTWNYIAVHVTGAARAIHDAATKRSIVERLARQHEAGRPQPWSPDGLPAEFLARQLEGIVGIAIAIERVEGKRKLSQNRSAADRAGVIAGLNAAGDPQGLAVAGEMATELLRECLRKG